MSLLERVTSFESLAGERGRERSESPSSRSRKLSFNPVPGSWYPTAEEETPLAVAAFEVSRFKRICEFSSVFLLNYPLHERD